MDGSIRVSIPSVSLKVSTFTFSRFVFKFPFDFDWTPSEDRLVELSAHMSVVLK